MMNPINAQQPDHISRAERKVDSADLKDWRILLVDDELDNLAVAETVLRFHGAAVRTACNGLQGLEALRDDNPTVILTDLSMPDLNGWEMLKQIRQNPDTAAIPVIALTAHAMRGDEGRVLDAGFDGYIPKPFSIATLIDDIRSILATKV